MKAKSTKILQVMAAALLLPAANAQPAKGPEAIDARFAKLRSLTGEWEASAGHDGKALPVTTSFKLVADGSAMLDDLAPGTPHEMVTMFHMDGKDLLATHYCAHHNQPRLRAVEASNPSVLEFVFKDATNLGSPSELHMTAVKFTIVDANHHTEEWTAMENGQPVTMRFEFHRKQ